MNRIPAFRAFTALLCFAAALLAGCASAPSGTGWVMLIDGGKGLENFTRLGDANWRVVDGAIQADRKNGTPAGILLSKDSWRDFDLYAEFWADEEANSGIYIRVTNRELVNTKGSYEVQIWDKSPTFATASLMPPAKAAPTFKAAGRWNTMRVTAKGARMTVSMNGEQAVDVEDTAFPAGPIALQYNAGIIRFRRLMIRPL